MFPKRHLSLLSLAALATFASVFSIPVAPVISAIPDPDGLLHIYSLPVGQGDSQVVQCPSGTLTVVDLGSSDDITAGYWFTTELQAFFAGKFDQIRNIILTHNHYDHYSFLPYVMTASAGLTGLQNIYISCTPADQPSTVSSWITAISGQNLQRVFNGGLQCGANGVDCGLIDLCPLDSAVVARVLSVNAGQQCNTGGNKNPDSIVFRIYYNNITIEMNGDFEDFTSSETENGPLQEFVDYYGASLKVDIYKISHHGAETYANKKFLRDVLQPKAVFVSANTWYSYGHPRCSITDDFRDVIQCLCKPLDTDPASPFYCGEHPDPTATSVDKLQQVFTCGEESDIFRTDTNNEYAIYSTVPDNATMNLIDFQTDGTKWGFINNFSPSVMKRK